MSCLYILEINPLSAALFAKILSHSVGHLFILLMIPFTMQKFLSLIRSHVLIFVFIFITPGGGSKNNIVDLCHRVIYLFSCKGFIVSGLKFVSLIHFKFIFVYGIVEWLELLL